MLGGVIAATRGAAGDPIRDALQDVVQREMRTALDVLKYRDAAISPASIATTVPMPTGSPLPLQLSIHAASNPDGTYAVTIDARASDGSGEAAKLTSTIGDRAPLPGEQIRAPGLVPAPTGAP